MTGADFSAGFDGAGPARTTDWVTEFDWLGAAWRLGLGIGADGRVWRLTIDPAGKEADAGLVATVRHAFALASAMLPCPHDALAEFADRFLSSPLAEALRELVRVEEAIRDGRELAPPQPAWAPGAGLGA